MKITGARKGLAALGLLCLIYATGAGVVRAAEPTRLRLLAGRLPVVAVYLNGDGPFDLLLDTGTNTTIVSPALAARLGLRPVDSITLITVAGESDVPLTRLGKVEVGGRAASGVEAIVSGLEALSEIDPRVCGVLGQNFLGRFNYTLDYGGRAVEFEGDAVPPSGERVPFATEEGKLVVVAVCDAPAPRALRLVLDAAASSLVIFDDARRSLSDKLAARAAGLMLTAAGGTEARLTRLPALRVGDSRLRDIPVALLNDPARRDARAEDGLLPTSLFRAVYFNHAAGYVIFNPKRTRG